MQTSQQTTGRMPLKKLGIDPKAVKARAAAERTSLRARRAFERAADEVARSLAMLSGYIEQEHADARQSAKRATRDASCVRNALIRSLPYITAAELIDFHTELYLAETQAAAFQVFEEAACTIWRVAGEACDLAWDALPYDAYYGKQDNYSPYLAALGYPAVVAAVARVVETMAVAVGKLAPPPRSVQARTARENFLAVPSRISRAAGKAAPLALASADAERTLRELSPGRSPLSRAERAQIIALFAQTCAYCAGSSDSDVIGPDDRSWHIDHVFPVVRGGTNVAENLVLSCATCNQSKHDRLGYTPARPS